MSDQLSEKKVNVMSARLCCPIEKKVEHLGYNYCLIKMNSKLLVDIKHIRILF